MNEQHTVNVQEAFDPELRQAQADMDAYIQSRPYKDDKGNIHSPEGSFINSDQYFDAQREAAQAEGQTAYEDMSMPDLARNLAKAEHYDDKTMANDVHEVLLDKITKKHKKTQSSRDVKHNAQRMDNLVTRVMTIKDKELERLQNEENTDTDTEPTSPDSATPDDDRRPHRRGDGVITAPEADSGAYGSPEEGPSSDDETQELPEIPADHVEKGDYEGDYEGEEVSEPDSRDDSEGNRWARFKRGVWKHLYESPIIAPEGYDPMTPMGPPIQPGMPFEQWYAENHQEDSRRQRRILAAVGALAAAGVIALGLAGGKESGQGSPDNVAHEHYKAGIAGAVKLPGAPEAKTTVRLKPGDNPWTASEDILQARGNAHPTPAQIEEMDKQMAELNPDKYSYSGDSSEHLPVGTELKVPKP